MDSNSRMARLWQGVDDRGVSRGYLADDWLQVWYQTVDVRRPEEVYRYWEVSQGGAYLRLPIPRWLGRVILAVRGMDQGLPPVNLGARERGTIG